MEVKAEFVPHWYGGVNFSFWRIIGQDFQKTGNWKSKEQAEAWAIENGYQIKED